MGIEPTPNIFERMIASDRKKLGRRGETNAEAMHRYTTILERKIHDQFISFLRRHQIPYLHSSPVRKSSIQIGHPDFTLLYPPWLLIEFKVSPNQLSVAQLERIAELERAGNHVHVIEESQPGEAYTRATGLVRDFYSLPEGLE